MLAKAEYFSPPDEACCWPGRRGGEAGRGADAGGWGLPGRYATAVRAVAQKHREEAFGKRVHGWQGDARRERCCTAGKEMQDWQLGARLARRCTMGEALHDGQAPLRQGNRVYGRQGDARRATACTMGKRVPGYFCLGGALRGYILSITSIGTPRIRCSCLFVAE